eukprot:SM002476S08565  [mRNA]  locus=s2476:55:1682:- [translate_table: standard]
MSSKAGEDARADVKASIVLLRELASAAASGDKKPDAGGILQGGTQQVVLDAMKPGLRRGQKGEEEARTRQEALQSRASKQDQTDKERLLADGLDRRKVVEQRRARAGWRAWSSGDVALALFDDVVFPGWSRAYHIFEPRYRLMVKECVQEGRPFGIAGLDYLSGSQESTSSSDVAHVIGTLAAPIELLEDDTVEEGRKMRQLLYLTKRILS